MDSVHVKHSFLPLASERGTAEKHAHKPSSLVAWMSGLSAAISCTPLLLPKLGLDRHTTGGEAISDLMRGGCCPIITDKAEDMGLVFGQHRDQYGIDYPIVGIAGALSHAYSKIPVVGNALSKGDVRAALMGAGLIVAGHYVTSYLEKKRTSLETSHWTSKIRPISQAVGILIGLPAILPGVGHGIQFLTGVVGIDTLGRDENRNPYATGPMTWVAPVLGKVPGPCKLDQKLIDGMAGGMAAPVAQLCCILPALIASLATHLGKKTPEDEPHVKRLDQQKELQVVSANVRNL